MSGMITPLHIVDISRPLMTTSNDALPAEVLEQIFLNFVEEEILPPTKPTLLTVTQVCRFWRETSLGNPRLWRSVSINLKDAYRLERIMTRLSDMWFSNAQDLPLALTIYCPSPDYTSPHVAELLDPLLPHFRQFQELHIAAYSISTLTTQPLSAGDFPCLESASLILPKIQIWQSYSFAFPWSQLAHLKISQILRTDAFLSIFFQCLRLEIGCFRIRTDVRGTSPPQHVTFKHLSSLAITYYRTRLDIGHLSNLSFPALRDLSLDTVNCGTEVNEFLCTFRGNTLRRLCLAGVRVKSDVLKHFLSTCGMLEELRVHLPLYGKAVFPDIRTGLEASRLPPHVPLALTSFITCIPTADYFDIDYEFEQDRLSIPQAVLVAEFLIWWCEYPTHPQRGKVATVFFQAQNYGKFKTEDRDLTQIAMEKTRSILRSRIHDVETCTDGLLLDTRTSKFHFDKSPVV